MATPDSPGRKAENLRDWIAARWAEALSARQIAQLTCGVMSRSAVIGVVHRMGLGGRRPSRPAVKIRRSPKAVEPEKRKKPVVRKLAAYLPPLPAAEHSDRPCEWPYGDGAEATVCGRVRDPDDWRARYCVDHRAAAVRPQKGGAIVLTPRAAPDLSRARFAAPFHFGGRG